MFVIAASQKCKGMLTDKLPDHFGILFLEVGKIIHPAKLQISFMKNVQRF